MGGNEQRIVSNPSVCGGQPCFRGTRVPVHLVLDFLGAGDSVEDVLTEYPQLSRDDVLAANELLEALVLKGGNALRLVYRLVRRTTLDLDFSMPEEFPDAATAAVKLFGALRRKLDVLG